MINNSCDEDSCSCLDSGLMPRYDSSYRQHS